MRPLLAALAAAWFLFQSVAFVAAGAHQIDWPFGVVDGDPAAVAVTSAARVVSLGLALVSAAMVDLRDLIDGFRVPPPQDG